MIPTYLRGKSAAQIMDRITPQRESMDFLNAMLMIAIKDALCSADGLGRIEDRADAAEGRAIAFLNLVAPYRGSTFDPES